MRNLWLLFLVGLASGLISDKLFVSSGATSSTTDDLYIEGRTSGDLPIDDEDGDDDESGSGSGDYVFKDLADKEDMLLRFLNFSQTTVSKETVPTRPQPTAGSPHNPTTATADSQDPSTTVEDKETTSVFLNNGDNSNKEMPGPTADADWFTQSPSSTRMPSRDTTSRKLGIDITVTTDTEDNNSLDSRDVSTPKSRGEDVIEEVDNDIVLKRGRIYEQESPEEVTSENMWERTEVLAAVIACGVVGFLCAVFLLLLLAYRMKKKDEGSYDLGDTKASTTAYHKAPTKEFYA
ncbi:syndecan-2-like [Centropristis striata]|uniref:syndecan-2-like n=1 Tax=Centropristis striata TaxID=184440 RepID=UPI0027E15B4C|nr:syndecan-2-like [Centropristis striata]